MLEEGVRKEIPEHERMAHPFDEISAGIRATYTSVDAKFRDGG